MRFYIFSGTEHYVLENSNENSPFLTQSALSRQLKELVTHKLIIRTDYQTIPPKVEYSLSATGKNFIPIIKSLEAWAEQYEKFLDEESWLSVTYTF